MLNRLRNERGFTLIELLVVMIIIGILAAVAIPIFMNQQKTSRDTATTSDVKNVATNIQSMLVQIPDANEITWTADANGTGGIVRVADTRGAGKSEETRVSLTSGTVIRAFVGSVPTADPDSIPLDAPGTFVVRGYNPAGKTYTTNARALVYNSNAGGLQK